MFVCLFVCVSVQFLASFSSFLADADKFINVNIIRVYIERNNMQVN